MKKTLLFDRAFNTPLLVHAGKANILAPVLAREILGASDVVVVSAAAEVQPPDRHAGKLGRTGDETLAERVRDQLVPRTRNGVGLIAVEGTLINKGGWIGTNSGETSYQGLMRQITEARDDPAIKAVVFEFDTFGGEVAGCADCGAAIADLSKEKPTIAILTDHSFSAGYWLASQCRQIVLPAAGGCGSIGVITMHVDYSAYLESEGVKVTVLTAGEHKADGHPYAELPEAVRDEWLAELELLRNQFADAVAAGRGKRFDKNAALATEARCFLGEDAVKAGLADTVARPSEAFNAFVRMF